MTTVGVKGLMDELHLTSTPVIGDRILFEFDSQVLLHEYFVQTT